MHHLCSDLTKTEAPNNPKSLTIEWTAHCADGLNQFHHGYTGDKLCEIGQSWTQIPNIPQVSELGIRGKQSHLPCQSFASGSRLACVGSQDARRYDYFALGEPLTGG
ncbi:hypothetical protein RRG08_045402 [Elysia crispata]|uniref:Uncharacterized protein n=1 Tax=Elysia crispata TaxID=231223 RepID=A0AAE1ANK5_9GAST|nr:hypothetical protein RRG08_045402 [Elysia crispata]